MTAAPQTSSGDSGMDLFANQIIKWAVLVAGCVFSIIIGVQVTSSESNGLAIFMRYLAAAGFVLALVSPRLGVYAVLFISPVLDLVKRTLILFDSLNMMDVASVLALAPVTLAGSATGLFFSRFIFRRKTGIPGERTLFAILLSITFFIILTNVLHATDSKLMLMRDLAEGCVYLCLILLIPVYFPTTEDIARLLRWCVVIYVPVALYGYWQKVFGLSEFEWHYLLSGLTITSGDFLMSERVFSTLNSNHSFSVTMACCAVICLLQRYLPPTPGQRFIRNHPYLLSAIFCIATIVSLRRTGWLVVGFSLAGAFCFRTRLRTIVFYGLCLIGTLLIIFNTTYIYDRLPVWESSLEVNFLGVEQPFQLETFNDRLSSFESLRTEKGIWTAFGVPVDQLPNYALHDAISQSLAAYGVVGVLGFLTVLIAVLSVSHRLVWYAVDAGDRSYAALLLSLIFSNLFVGALMQSHITIFPINFIFWMCVGALLKITFNQQTIAPVKQKLQPLAIATILKAKDPLKVLGRYPLPEKT